MRFIKRALFGAVLLASVTVAAQTNYSGAWQVSSGPLDESDGTHPALTASVRNHEVTFAYRGGSMTCTLSADHCRGTWHRDSESGWFNIAFGEDGQSFSGNWGLANTQASSGGFHGHR